jgi:hypothetical protein
MSKKDMQVSDGNTALTIPDDVLPDGAGLENADMASFATPFIRLLQKGSPQADPDSESYIEGTKAGMLYDTVGGEVIDPEKEKVQFIPVGYKRVFVEWVPRNEKDTEGREGFIAEYNPAEGEELMRQTTLNEKNRDILPNGHELSDTRIHYVVVVRENGMFYPGVVNMERTQVKRSRRWFSDMNKQVTARGLRATCQLIYTVGSEAQQKDNNTWRIWDIKAPTLVSDQEQLNAAIKFYKAFEKGAVSSVDADPAEKEATAPVESEDPTPQPSEPATF